MSEKIVIDYIRNIYHEWNQSVKLRLMRRVLVRGI